MAKYLHIIGGKIYDPINRVDGQAFDLFVADGKIVDSLPPGLPEPHIQKLDASGMIVMPGAIDMHTHILVPWIDRENDAESTDLTPLEAAEKYLSLGYTTVIEAAVPPHLTGQTLIESDKLPLIDFGYLLEIGNNPRLIRMLDRNGDEAAFKFFQRLVNESDAMGIKLVNPGGLFGLDNTELTSIDDHIPTTDLTPRRIIRFITDSVKKVGINTPIFLHAPQLGLPGNIQSTIEILKAFGDTRVHLAHAQFYAYGQDGQGMYTSAADTLINMLIENPHITADAGPLMFGNTSIFSLDTALISRLTRVPDSTTPKQKTTLCYDPHDAVNSIQWATALELMLICRDRWKIALALDHPNCGSIGDYPHAYALLMDKNYRNTYLEQVHPTAKEHTGLSDVSYEYTLSELAITTRAAPAQIMGLSDHKGHLGTGADADIAIYRDQLSDKIAMFTTPRWVIKSGDVAVDHCP